MSGTGFSISPNPRSRRVIVDTGAAASKRHSIIGLLSLDITRPREILRALPHPRPTLTAYLVACIARAAATRPGAHAARDLRNRIWTPNGCDVNVMVEVELEGRSFPMNHVLRDADRRTPDDLSAEMRRIKTDPVSSPTASLEGAARWYLRLPGWLRVRLLGLIHRLPAAQRRMMGTIGVTSVGMYGEGSGHGIAFQVHTLDVVIGGIETRTGPEPGTGQEKLAVTLMFDHDVVDGAPAARFAAHLRTIVESAELLQSPGPG